LSTLSESEQKQAELMMKNIVELGKYSYDLEEKREQSLITQSSQMLTAFSIFSAVLFVILPIIIETKTVSVWKLLFSAGIISVFLLASLVLALIAQWRFKYSTMQDVQVFYDRVNAEFQNYASQVQFDVQWKEQLLSIHASKKKNNDKRAKLVIASMVVFLISIGLLLASAFFLILGHI